MATAPHLLALPRELRNQIYSYLSYSKYAGLINVGDTIMQICFESLPNTTITQVHPQLRNEYIEDNYAQNASVTLQEWDYHLGEPKALPKSSLPKIHALMAAVRHARVSLLRFYLSPSTLWDDVKKLLGDTTKRMPHLQRLTLAAGSMPCPAPDTDLFRGSKIDPSLILTDDTDFMLIPDPPSTLFGLQFASGFQGFRVEYFDEDPGCLHQFTMLGVYVYNADGLSELVPESAEILDPITTKTTYPPEVLKSFSKDKAALLSKSPLVKWSEMNAKGYTMSRGVKQNEVKWPPRRL